MDPLTPGPFGGELLLGLLVGLWGAVVGAVGLGQLTRAVRALATAVDRLREAVTHRE